MEENWGEEGDEDDLLLAAVGVDVSAGEGRSTIVSPDMLARFFCMHISSHPGCVKYLFHA